MPTSLSVNTETTRHSIPLLLALIAVGLMGNYLKYPIFLNIDFLFGSIFAMLALQFFGLSRGILAAVIIAGYTYVNWNHPYAIVIMTAEVAIVGLLMRWRKFGMVLADTLYWLIIGMPLVYLFYHVVMHVPLSNTTIVMIKQAMNGISNALIARLIFTGFALWSRSSLTSLSDIVYNLLASFVLFPALIILAISSRSDFNETDRDIRSTLIHGSQHVSGRLETWLLNRKLSIIYLAELAASKSPQEMQPHIEQAKKSDVNYLRIGLADKDAISVAFAPLVDEMGVSSIGVSCADRLYLPILKQTLKPMLSEVSLGKMGIISPRVLMLAPVVVGGQFSGYVTGSLDLSQMQEYFDNSSEQNSRRYTLLDKNDKVILTNRTDQTIMAPFVRGQGTLNHINNGMSQWVPVVSPNTPISERWKQSFYVAESTIGKLAEWKLILEQPVAPFQKTLYDSYTAKLTLLFLILLGSLVLAEILSRRSMLTLEKLRMITSDLPVRLATDSKEIVWPQSGIKETHYLVNNFKEMANSIAEQFVKIGRINHSLQERMEELRKSEERFANMFRKHSAVMLLLEPETGAIIDANLAAEQFYQYPRATLLAMNIGDINILPPDAIKEGLNNVLTGQNNFFVFSHKKASGEIRTVEVHSTSICINDTVKLFSIVNDITERKQIEEEKSKLEAQNRQFQKAESLAKMAGAIAHHFNNQLGVVLGNLEMSIEDLQLGVSPDESLNNAIQATHKAAEVSALMLTYLGQTTGKHAPLDLCEICRQSLPLLQAAVPKNQIFEVELPSPGPIINGNINQIQQVVTNLTANAQEAIGENEGAVNLMVKRVSQTDIPTAHRFPVDWTPRDLNYACLEVGDTGCGIAKGDIDKLFDPFFTTKFTGRGLGLSVVMGIIKAHNGGVTVESETGRGTIMRVFLPVSTEEIPGQPVRRAQSSEVETGGTVLLVEDEEMLREMADNMLTRLGYKVLAAKDGIEALEIFKNHLDEIHVVVSDLSMPRMGGWETLTALRQIRPDIPVILASGHDESRVLAGDHPDLPQVFLHKPYQKPGLQDALARAMVRDIPLSGEPPLQPMEPPE